MVTVCCGWLMDGVGLIWARSMISLPSLIPPMIHHASNTLTTFTVDYEKNIIVMNGKPIKITEPNCIRIWPVPEE